MAVKKKSVKRKNFNETISKKVITGTSNSGIDVSFTVHHYVTILSGNYIVEVTKNKEKIPFKTCDCKSEKHGAMVTREICKSIRSQMKKAVS